MAQDQQPIPSPVSIGVDGGLNLKTDPQRLQPPAVTRADNAWHVQPGNVQQLPGFVTQLSQAATPLHVYNLATRDLSPPAPAGDLLLHGEYADTNIAGMTRSLWSVNSGAAITTGPGSLPFVARIRPLGGYLTQAATLPSTSSSTPAVGCSPPSFARETGAARPRFAMATIATTAGSGVGGTVNLVTGYVNSTTRIAATTSSAWYMDIGEIQTTSNFCLFYQTGSQFYIDTWPYTLGTLPTSSVQVTSPAPLTTTTANGCPLLQLLQHNGRTYALYVNNATNFNVVVRDVLTGTSTQLTGISKAAAPLTLAAASPYTHTTSAAVTYYAVVYDRTLYVCSRDTDGTHRVVSSAANIFPPSEPSVSAANYSATCCVNILDSQGGTGANAVLGISVFFNVYEAPGAQISGRTVTYQQVQVTQYRFTAAASTPAVSVGTLSYQNLKILRLPNGAQVASRAFCACPPESLYSGPSAAKQGLCMVQSGAVEPEISNAYNTTALSTDNICRDAQPTFFLVNHRGEIVGRYGEGQAPTRPSNFVWAGTVGTPTAAPAFPRCYNLGNPLFSSGTPDDVGLGHISVPVWLNSFQSSYVAFVDASGTPFDSAGISQFTAVPALVTLTMDRSAISCQPVSTANHLYLNGCIGQLHDGDSVVEQNWHYRASPPIVTGTTYTASANASAGYYRIVAVYSWTDAQGFTHRSAPSLGSTITQAAGAVPNVISLTVLNPQTDKGVLSAPVTVDIFITSVASGDGLRLLGSTVLTPLNSVSNSSTMYTSFTLTYDATRTPYGRALYTSVSATASNTYAAQPPRTSFAQIAGKGRVFALSQVAGQQRIYYSSAATQAFPFEWNDLNYAAVPPEIGDPRSLEIIDDKVIVLGTRGNAAMSGDGPPASNTGGAPAPNDGFSPVTPIPTPAGVLGTGSPARVPEGLIFTGYSGIQLVGRDLNIQPIGMPVDQLTGRQVGTPGTIYGRAVTLPSLQSVVYPNPRGPALVYSYLTKRWSTWPLLSNCLTLAQRMDGTLYAAIQPIGTRQLSTNVDFGILSTASYGFATGTSSAPGLVLETPWVAIGGVTGCEADLFNAELIGTWLGPHTLLIEQAYNYRDYVLPQTTDMSASPGEYMVRVRPLQNTRVWAVRYRISLLPLTTLNAGYPMAALADLVIYSAVQGGTAQIDAARTR